MQLQVPIFLITNVLLRYGKSQIPECGVVPRSCGSSHYRSLDGSCNHLEDPGLGMAHTRFNRMLPPKYGNGISTPTTQKNGKELPDARLLSLLLYPDAPIKDPKFTLAAMQYGQIITHDMSRAPQHVKSCCTSDGHIPTVNVSKYCFPIKLHDQDPMNKNTSKPNYCMEFTRTITDRDEHCGRKNHPVAQLSAVTHYLDLSVVYGSSDEMGEKLRTLNLGGLKAERRNEQEWLPRSLNLDSLIDCDIQSSEDICYRAGDPRVNQSPQLTVLQTLLLREHNRIAHALANINKHWNDEVLYQEARKINTAQHQSVTYGEWLPLFIGAHKPSKRRLQNTKRSKFQYDQNIDPRVLNEHATAEFRFFHSLIAGHLDLVNDVRKTASSLHLGDWFGRPIIIEKNNNFDDLLRGMASQKQMKSDRYHSDAITQYFFRGSQQFGSDVKAIDIQRNRDHGLASYNDMRKFCGLRKAEKFEDFLGEMSKDNVNKLKKIYNNVNDVDLTVGGSLETLVPSTLVGPTFLCILTEQFYRTKFGDRFWFENSGPTGFSTAQLNEIRNASISRLFCDNGRNIISMQRKGFRIISRSNPLVSCHKLPKINLSLWKEPIATRK